MSVDWKEEFEDKLLNYARYELGFTFEQSLLVSQFAVNNLPDDIVVYYKPDIRLGDY